VDDLAQQQLGIEVALAVAQPEVQLVARPADHGAGAHLVARAKPGRREPAVRRS
jgi:hypothetical protein